MLRALLAVTALFALLAPVAQAASPETRLTIAYWQDGREPDTKRTWTLRCGPPGGTWPFRTAACRVLARPDSWRLFRRVPPAAVCTEIYGGPQVAIVTGQVNGRRLWAKFTRERAVDTRGRLWRQRGQVGVADRPTAARSPAGTVS